ncbi:MAG: hypothetical protein HRU19_15090 [Pseudobacteriovorax sp.]|nr:hypothetical protein [Pseudobacteriovorax sp.]
MPILRKFYVFEALKSKIHIVSLPAFLLGLSLIAFSLMNTWETSLRPLYDQNYISDYIAGIYKPYDIRSVRDYKFKVSKEVGSSTLLAVNPSKSGKHFSSIAIQIGTHMRSNECRLKVVVNGNNSSAFRSCLDIVDNQYFSFQLERPISAGEHSLRVIWEASQPNKNFLAIYAAQKQGEHWLLPMTGQETKSGFDVFTLLYRYDWKLSVFYSIVLVFFLLGLSVKKMVSSIIIVLCTFFLVLTTLMPPFFVGHDETAHLDVFFSTINVDVPQNQIISLMKEEDFFRLNQVKPPDSEDACIHSIVDGSCGRNKPQLEWLYNIYAKIIGIFGDISSPKEVLTGARVINICGFGLLFLFIAVYFGKLVLASSLVLTCLFGTILGQLSTLTNDIPLYIIGILLMLFLYDCIKSRKRLVPNFVFVGLLVSLGLNLDVSGFFGLAVVILLPMIFILGKKNSILVSKYQFCLSLLIGFIASIFLLPILMAMIGEIETSLKAILPNADIVKQIFRNLSHRQTFQDLLSATFLFFRSIFSSFVWGHSYYQPWSYLLLALLFIVIYRESKSHFSRNMMIVCLLAFIMGMSFIPLINSAPGLSGSVEWEPFLKPRFLAPFLPTMLMGFFYTIRQNIDNSNILRCIGFFLLNVLCLELPRIYLVDRL